MVRSVRVYAEPSDEAVERGRLALSELVEDVTVSSAREASSTVVTASWSSDVDASRAEQLRGVLVDALSSTPSSDAVAAVDGAAADLRARLDRVEAKIDAMLELLGSPPGVLVSGKLRV